MSERSDLFVLAVYTLVVVILTLTLPLAMQAIVNTVATGIFVQPLVILTLLVLGGLGAAAVLQVMQVGIVEMLQQRVFASTGLEIARKLVSSRTSAMRASFAPELVHRFFDILTVQKALSKLLLDGLTALVQAVVAVAVLAFFSPMLLLVGVSIIGAFIASTLLLGWGGVRSSLDESREKYQVAGWLDDLARCQTAMKLYGGESYLSQRTDEGIVAYLRARDSHFRVYRRQLTGSLSLWALGNAGLLSAGGWLVLTGGLTLGQLVAAQIIVALVLSALDKVGRQTEKFFDLVSGWEKVGAVLDLPEERYEGRSLPDLSPGTGATVTLGNVKFGYEGYGNVLNELSFTLNPGARVSLVGASGAGKSTVASLICGLDAPSGGVVEVDGVDTRDAHPASLRRRVALVGDQPELFAGTLYENITIGREHVGQEDVRWALEMAGLTEDAARLPKGLSTEVRRGGGNLSTGFAQRLLLARAIVGRPRLLILDEAFTGIDERTTGEILDRIFDRAHGWTILDISHEIGVVMRTEVVHVLQGGRIVESGKPEELVRSERSELTRLFPTLGWLFREGARR